MPVDERLRYARERVSLTGVRAAELAGIGASTLSEFEHGKRQPSLSQLQKLAEVYRRSVAFFLDEGPVVPEVVLWRQRPADAEAIEATFLRFCEQYHNLEVWCGEKALASLPQWQGNAMDFDFRQAKLLAKQTRDQLQLGDRPGQTLLHVLEEVCGIKAFRLDFQPSGSAASTWSDVFGPAVLLNANNARWRRNYDLAHELFHLITWSVFRKAAEVNSVIADDREESLANCFASCLLMPEEAVRLAVADHVKDGKIPYDDLFDIARQFDVSVEALLWRMHFLFRGPGDADRTRREIDRAKELTPLMEEREQEASPRWPARYHALAIRALRHGEVSLGRFAEYLGITRREAMRYVEQEATDGEEVQVASA